MASINKKDQQAQEIKDLRNTMKDQEKTMKKQEKTVKELSEMLAIFLEAGKESLV